MPELRHLSCTGIVLAHGDLIVQELQHLQSVSFRRSMIPDLILPDTIKEVSLLACNYRPSQNIPGSDFQFSPLPNLEKLCLAGSETSTRDTCGLMWKFVSQALLKTPPGRLQSLSISFSEGDLRRWNDVLLNSLCLLELRRLQLSSFYLGDDQSMSLRRACPALEHLCILEAHAITGVFVSDWIKASTSKLKRVVLVECVKVFHDLVPWAAARGVEVQMLTSAAFGNGNKVRYGE
jgi:hypothetical protein